jgi:PemK-like, MazF-like toxin of type II toxin-antitoxin system
MALRDSLLRAGMKALGSAVRSTARPAGRSPRPRASSQHGGASRGDFEGAVPVEYAPQADGKADPGEVVWAWVPYEEGDGRGKDRPVLVVGRDGDALLALMLTSKDHDRDAADEARWGRSWMDIGTGAWDRRGRPSEVRLDRVLRLAPAAVRREGCHLDRARFDEVTRELGRVRGGR